MDLLMRSKLFVPASRPELFDKALASEADAISFDLEDAVQESRKDSARQTLQAFVHSMQLAVRLAAAEAGVWACDTVYGAVKDPDGYTREAEAARRLGFIGKSCIHPTQTALANAVFRPSDAEIAAALRVVEAARGAEANGVGAFLVDGRMIDIPFITRAQAILGAARRLGLLAAS